MANRAAGNGVKAMPRLAELAAAGPGAAPTTTQLPTSRSLAAQRLHLHSWIAWRCAWYENAAAELRDPAKTRLKPAPVGCS